MTIQFKRDSYCNYCGTALPAPLAYPHTCQNCHMQLWANPIPVAVPLIAVEVNGKTGLLVVRRTIAPVGLLALPGGFMEAHEPWQVATVREAREEAGVEMDPASVAVFSVASGQPVPNRLLVFATTAKLVAPLPPFIASSESSERGVVFGPGGLSDIMAFPLHVQAVEAWFAKHGLIGANDYQVV